MDSLAARLTVALGDRPICSVYLDNDQRHHLRLQAGSRSILDAALADAARRNPEARARLKALVVLDADMGLSPDEISERTGGAISAEEADRIVAEWTHGVEYVQQRLLETAGSVAPPPSVTMEKYVQQRLLEAAGPVGPPLNVTMKNILEALKELGARDRASARSKVEIAKKAGLKSHNARNFREAMKQLKEEGLRDSATGQNGGMWITPKGIAAITR